MFGYGYGGRIIGLSLLNLHINSQDNVYWFEILSIDREEDSHALLYIERTLGGYKFDFLFLRTFIYWWRRTNA